MIYMARDASNLDLGAIILHKEKYGQLKVVHHASRILLTAEITYSQIEKEGLGLTFAVQKFHKYIHGIESILQTDHRPLVSIFGSRKGIPTHSANRRQRCGSILLNNPFKMEFLLSKKIPHADGLAGLIPKIRELLKETVIVSLDSEMDIKNVLYNTVKEL